MQIPNIVGFTFGVLQMVLYAIYRKWNPPRITDQELKLPQLAHAPKPDVVHHQPNINKKSGDYTNTPILPDRVPVHEIPLPV